MASYVSKKVSVVGSLPRLVLVYEQAGIGFSESASGLAKMLGTSESDLVTASKEAGVANAASPSPASAFAPDPSNTSAGESTQSINLCAVCD